VAPGADGVNRVDYAGVTAEDRWRLNAYLLALPATRDSRYNRREHLAFSVAAHQGFHPSTFSVVLTIRHLESRFGWSHDRRWKHQQIHRVKRT